MNGWMGLICLLAYVWLAYCALTGRVVGQGEAYALSAIMAVAATRFLIVWNREARKAYNEYMEGE